MENTTIELPDSLKSLQTAAEGYFEKLGGNLEEGSNIDDFVMATSYLFQDSLDKGSKSRNAACHLFNGVSHLQRSLVYFVASSNHRAPEELPLRIWLGKSVEHSNLAAESLNFVKKALG